jgi:sugar/nucleoside kinase (ribokinase family)
MTTEDSASGEVDADAVARSEAEFERAGRRGVALAVPEVPLDARAKVLELATRYGLFRVANFSSGEMDSVRRLRLLEQVDVLALNQDEARSLVEVRLPEVRLPEVRAADLQKVAEHLVEHLARGFPHLLVSLTAGAAGSWSWDGERLLHLPAINVPVATTSGAGDAHLAGIVAGLAAGLSMSDAHRLGVILAAASVTSPHTIHKDVARTSLADLAMRGDIKERALLSLLDVAK